MERVSGRYSSIPVRKLLCREKIPQMFLNGVVVDWHEFLSADPDKKTEFKRICSEILCAHMLKDVFPNADIVDNQFLDTCNELFESVIFTDKEIEDIKILCTRDNVRRMLSDPRFYPPQVDRQFILQMRATDYLDELVSTVNAQFTSQEVRNSKLCYVVFPPNQQIARIKFISSEFISAMMCKVKFSNVTFCQTKLNECNLTDAKFLACPAIEECSFDGSIMYRVSFENQIFVQCSFVDTSLNQANLSGASFLQANIKGACFNGANLDQVTFSALVFDEAIRDQKYVIATTINFIKYLQAVSSINNKYTDLKIKLMAMIFDNYKDERLILNLVIHRDYGLFPTVTAIIQVVRYLFLDDSANYLDLIKMPQYKNLLDNIIIGIEILISFNFPGLSPEAASSLIPEFNHFLVQLRDAR